MESKPWHQLEPAQVLARLGVDPRLGLHEAQVQARRAALGPNALALARGTSVPRLILRQLGSFIVILLLFAAGLSLVLGEALDALAIFAALLLNAAIGFAMDLKAERELRSLQALSVPGARVRRGGQELELSSVELVPGDVLLLQAGDRVPADCRLIEGRLDADESLLTGESQPVAKRPGPLAELEPVLAERYNELFAGTLLTRGGGVAVVTAIGEQTEVGRVGRLLVDTVSPATPLSERLEILGRYLVWLIAAMTAFIVTLGLLQGRELLPLLETGVVLAIAAIPEGLPAVATLALAAGARRLARQGVLLRQLGALEALGSVTTLCLDKTGTLTANAMTVRAVRVPGHGLEVTGEGWAPRGELRQGERAVSSSEVPGLRALLETVQLCNDATLESEGAWHIHGDPSEGALLTLAAKASIPDPRPGAERLRVIAAGEDRPWMLVVARVAGRVAAYVKGAPEHVLARSAALRASENLRPLAAAERADWERANQAFAQQAMRVLGVAVKPLPEGWTEADLEGGWEWLGLVGMADPPRQGVREVLGEAHRAGIRTLMITGDQQATATSIARELDLAGGRAPRVEVGSAPLTPDVDVYARATPAGKLALIRALQADDQLAAMTGDGVNDAPALRAATVGIAMGRGAAVAHEAADVVLTNDRLETLLAGIREGRTVFLNIQKGLDFLLTCSLSTLLVVLLTTAARFPLPLLPLQILYLNLLTHTFPALGLTLEPADPAVMRRPPLPRRAALLPLSRQATILSHSLIIAVVTLAVGAWGLHHEDLAHGRTLVFATIAGSLMLHTFSDRSDLSFGGFRFAGNPALLGFMAAGLALMLAAIYVPGLAGLLGITPLNGWDWLIVLLAALGSLVAIETSKRVLSPSGAGLREPQRA